MDLYQECLEYYRACKSTLDEEKDNFSENEKEIEKDDDPDWVLGEN